MCFVLPGDLADGCLKEICSCGEFLFEHISTDVLPVGDYITLGKKFIFWSYCV